MLRVKWVDETCEGGGEQKENKKKKLIRLIRSEQKSDFLIK